MSPEVMPLPPADGVRRNGGDGVGAANGGTPPANGTAVPAS